MGKRTGRPRGWLDDPAARRARAKKAGEASRAAYWLRTLAQAEGMTRSEAYAKGYRTGYARAYQFWRLKFARARAAGKLEG